MIKFTKMHGLGNDYVYIDATAKTGQKIENESDLAKFVSNRHFGIGSDGLILICDSKVADFKMRMFNYDGSEAEMCGNGIRCVGKFVYDKGLTNKESITVETLAGIKTLKFNIENSKVKTVQVDMGEPILNPQKIPVISEEKIVKRQFSWYDGIIKNSKERVSGGCRNGEAVMKKRISLWESRILRRYERMDIIMRMRAWRIEYE